MTQSLASKQANCLNTIRLLAAIQVMLGHASAHMSADFEFRKVINFFYGVPIFFIMSGFLIWNSIGRSKSFVEYTRKRFGRIYPELWAAVAIEIIVMLLFIETVPPIRDILVFIVTQSTILQFWTPDSMRIYGCGTPNGALWTITVLIQFYLAVWFVYKMLHGKTKKQWNVSMVLLLVIPCSLELVKSGFPNIVQKLYSQTLLPYLWLFMIGVIVAEYENIMLPILKKWWAVLLCVSMICYLARWDFPLLSYPLVRSTTLGLGLIGFAYAMPKLNISVDISYGLYIYHMTVINAMIAIGMTGRKVDVLIAMGISVLLACVSTGFAKKIRRRIKMQKNYPTFEVI